MRLTSSAGIGHGFHAARDRRRRLRGRADRWLVKAGDAVKRGQNLMEVMTDKATMEVPAPFAGTITALRTSPARRSRSAKSCSPTPPPNRPRRFGRRSPPRRPRHPGRPRRCWRTAPPPLRRESPAGQGGAVGAANGPQARRRSRVRPRQRPRGPHPDRGSRLAHPSGAPRRQARRRRSRRTSASRARASSSRGCGARSPSTWSRPSAPSRTTATSMNAT